MNLSVFQRFKMAREMFRLKSLDESTRALLIGNDSAGVISSSYESMSRNGYMENEIAYFIISDIAKSAASVDLLTDELPDEVVEVLERPQQGKPYDKWMFEQIAYRLIAGESYSEIIRMGTRIAELPIIRPDRISPQLEIGRGACEQVSSWIISCGSQKDLSPDDVWFSRLLHPLRDFEGWSPLQASRKSVQNMNEVANLNANLLRNNGAPLGFLKYMGAKIGKITNNLNEDQLNKVKEDFNSHYSDRSQSIKVTNSDFDFVRIGMTGKEMDFSKVDEASARKIALAFGYPPELLGFANGSTFSNRKEAREFLWTNTILPVLKQILCDLAVLFSVDEIKPDIEGIPALSEIIFRRREAARLDFIAGLITLEEAREEGGYPEEINGTLFVNPNKVPIGGSFPELDLVNEEDSASNAA